jgi:sugar-phosphatase
MQFIRVQADALLFDLDGVLVDSAQCVKRVCSEWALAHGLDPVLVQRIGQGRRVQETVRAVAPHLDVEAETAILVAMEASTTNGLFPVEGARTLIGALPADSWAVVTSGARAVATLRLRHVGLPIPSTFVTADDVTRGKPDPQGYLAAANALGFRPEQCVVVEDAPAGIEAARAAGMRSIGIAGTFSASEISGASVVVPSLSVLTVTVSSRAPRLTISVGLER